ncbi:acyl carrier protein [alpha proteobacterium U9-1i]|nr:acyl carrier protein [alpha proteobacterium U9-1i]
MTKDEVLAKLSTVVSDVLDLDDLKLTESMTANDVRGWDSLAHIRVVLAAEAAFKIRFDTAEMASLPTVGALADLIRQKVG